MIRALIHWLRMHTSPRYAGEYRAKLDFERITAIFERLEGHD